MRELGRELLSSATPFLLLLYSVSLSQQSRSALGQPVDWPVLLPKWQPEWTLSRSTIAQPCNYSGWFDPALGAQFGIISFDWANNENSWRQRPLAPGPNNTCLQPRGWAQHCYYPVQEDLITQAEKIKAIDNRTRVFVYRQGQGSPGAEGGKQGQALDLGAGPGFFLNAKGTNRSTGVFDFRNASVVDWFVNTLVGGPTCLGHPSVDGLFLDDVDGLGSPGSPDATPIVKEVGLEPSDVAAWNRGQRTAVIKAQKLAVERGKFNWQLLKPGIAGMLQPAATAASCINGSNSTAGDFPGLRKLCSKEVRESKKREDGWGQFFVFLSEPVLANHRVAYYGNPHKKGTRLLRARRSRAIFRSSWRCGTAEVRPIAGMVRAPAQRRQIASAISARKTVV
jgi:hypothetical protein